MTRARLLYPSSGSREKTSDRLREELKLISHPTILRNKNLNKNVGNKCLEKTRRVFFITYFVSMLWWIFSDRHRFFFLKIKRDFSISRCRMMYLLYRDFPREKIISIARNFIYIGKTVATDNISRRNFVALASPRGITELWASHAGLMLDRHVTVSVDVGSSLDTSHGRHLRRDHAGSPRWFS